MPRVEPCPMCGHTEEPKPKQFEGVGIVLPDSLAEMVDGIIERTGYGG